MPDPDSGRQGFSDPIHSSPRSEFIVSTAPDTPVPPAEPDRNIAEETPNPPTRTNEWWLKASIRWAEEANDRCLASLKTVIDAGAGGAAAEEAHQAAKEVREKIVVAGKFAAIVTAAKDHPGTTGVVVTAFLIGAIAATASLWPTGGTKAAPAPAPVVSGETAEARAVKLMKAGKYTDCQRLIDTEIKTPRGWHLRGEMERLKGNELLAKEWYQRAADAGDSAAALALTAAGRKE